MTDDLHYLQKIKMLEEGEEDEEEEDKNAYPNDQSIIAHSLDSLKKGENILIIDGAYFEIGIKDLERMNQDQKMLSVPENIKNLFSFISNGTGIKSFDWKSFHSAEEPKAKKQKAYYSVLMNDGFVFDIREFKSKKVRCPNMNGKHFNKAFVTKVQAEVDVAITMTTMQLLQRFPKIKNVVFVIGDRDFLDLFKYVRDSEITTWVFGFRANLSKHIFDVFPTEKVIYINDYWNSYITAVNDDEFPPLNPSNIKVNEIREINFKKTISETPKPRLSVDPILQQQASAKKKKPKKKKVKNKKDEEKKRPNYGKNELSRSSTDESLVEKSSKFLFLQIVDFDRYFIDAKQKVTHKSSLANSELDIFLGLGLDENDVKSVYSYGKQDIDDTLDKILTNFNI